jgi:hypothetical protein
MSKTYICAILVIGLLAGSAIGVVAQEEGSGQVLTPDTGDLFCVRASEQVEAERLQESVVAEAVTITVMPDAECASGAALDALSDAEHFGVYMGHMLDTALSVMAIGDELTTLPEVEGDVETWLTETVADSDTMAEVLAVFGRFVAVVDDELAWLEAHPPRPCYAGLHEAWRDWLDQGAAVFASVTTALRAQDVESLIQASADMQVFEISGLPDLDMSSQTCWPV